MSKERTWDQIPEYKKRLLSHTLDNPQKEPDQLFQDTLETDAIPAAWLRTILDRLRYSLSSTIHFHTVLEETFNIVKVPTRPTSLIVHESPATFDSRLLIAQAELIIKSHHRRN